MLRISRRSSLAALVSAGAALAAPGGASAAVICVPDTTVAADCGSSAATPQAGIDAAVSLPGSDTVRLAAGVYTGTIVKSTGWDAANKTTISGAGRTATIFRSGTGTDIISLFGNFALQDFGLDITGGELVPDQCTGLVDAPGSGKRARLPDPEDGAGRVGEDRHPAEVHHVHRLRHHGAAGRLDRSRRGIGVLDGDVGRPGGRLALGHQRHHPGDIRPVLGRAAVAAGLLDVFGLRDLQAEQAGVELDRGVQVGGPEVNPTRGPGGVTRSLAHLFNLSSKGFFFS